VKTQEKTRVYSTHIPINLASQPFRRDRPLLVASTAIGVALIALLALQVTVILQQREASRESRETLDGLQRQARALDEEQARLQTRLHEPANEAVLERSVFLNLLLHRKGISWTRMFSDLEGVFPGNVRLVAIRPYVTGDNRVQLDMVVGAQSPEPVIDLLKRLEDSPLFGETSLLNSQPPSQNEPLYRYRVSVNYAQKL
jgi:Tfp pilus assembly protein PilN